MANAIPTPIAEPNATNEASAMHDISINHIKQDNFSEL